MASMENATSTWKPLVCLCNRSLALGKTGKLQILRNGHPIELAAKRLANEFRLPIRMG